MPWTTADVEQHIKGLDDAAKEVWVGAANSALDACQKKGGKDCEAYAIMVANKAGQESLSFPVAPTEKELSEGDSSSQKEDSKLEKKEEKGGQMELIGDTFAFTEKAVGKEGTAMVKLIQPGWGSSGFYSREVLERDGPKVFKRGVKMFMDHPTPEEDSNRPERSLRDLAGELVEDSKFLADGQDGPGLYARVKVFSPFKEVINELAPHIGVSIRGFGKGNMGDVDGRQGRIVEELVAAKSVDYVTQAGAGGRVLELFEAARTRMAEDTSDKEAEMEELKEAQEALAKAEATLTELQESAKKRDEELARLREGLILREASDMVSESLAKSAALPDVTRDRLSVSLAQNPPIKDGTLDKEALAKKIEEGIKTEVEYLTKITGKDPVTSHGSKQEKIEDVQAKLTEAFRGLGLSDAAAKVAAQGR